MISESITENIHVHMTVHERFVNIHWACGNQDKDVKCSGSCIIHCLRETVLSDGENVMEDTFLIDNYYT